MDKLKQKKVLNILERALEEDIGGGDITSNSLVPDNTQGEARILAKEDCILAGCFIAGKIFQLIDKSIEVKALYEDGALVLAGESVLEIRGNLKTILVAERTILNFIQRLSGIATLTRKFVEIANQYEVIILDTRKTTPNLRDLEKYAVRVGGGENHRFGLFDQVLIKDNHLKVQERFGPDHIKRAVAQTRSGHPEVKIVVEVQSKQQAEAAVRAGADRILLDNMTPARIKEIVDLYGRDLETEASGGITLANIEEVAKTGVNYISLGGLTHSAKAVDLSLKVVS